MGHKKMSEDELLGKGIKLVSEKHKLDPLDNLENQNVENEALKDSQSTRGLREEYAARIIWFLNIYSIVVAMFVFLHGLHCVEFTLPDEVLITLVGSTAVAAIGLVGFVAKGLFNNIK